MLNDRDDLALLTFFCQRIAGNEAAGSGLKQLDLDIEYYGNISNFPPLLLSAVLI